jgi:hypothetical protein
MLAQLKVTRLGLTMVLGALAVALGGAQSAEAISVPVLIDAVTIEDGVAVLTGTVDAAIVEINGQIVEVGENGAFSAPISPTPGSRSTGRSTVSRSSTARCLSSRAGSWTRTTSRRSR